MSKKKQVKTERSPIRPQQVNKRLGSDTMKNLLLETVDALLNSPIPILVHRRHPR